MKKIKIRVDKHGKTKIEAFGYEGSDCLAATAGLRKALGITDEPVLKDEFFHTVEAEQVVDQEG